MAVECISGQQPMNASSDVWAWGVTLWEVIILHNNKASHDFF